MRVFWVDNLFLVWYNNNRSQELHIDNRYIKQLMKGAIIIYKELYLVTWYNTVTGTIEQILTESMDEAKGIAKKPERFIDRFMWRFMRSFISYTITTISHNGIYIDGEELKEPDSGINGNRFLVKMYGGSKGKLGTTALIGGDLVREMVLGHSRKMCGRNIVLNEIDYWGIYVLDEYGERFAKLNIGSKDSVYEKPEFIRAPTYKTRDPMAVYREAKTLSI